MCRHFDAVCRPFGTLWWSEGAGYDVVCRHFDTPLVSATRLRRGGCTVTGQVEFAVSLMPRTDHTAMALLAFVHHFGYRCLRCGGVFGDFGPFGLPAPAAEYIAAIKSTRFMHRGVNHGGWDNLVCM